MTASTTRKLSGVKYAATILGAFAVLAVAPATAFAVDDEPAPAGSCTHTDDDGYPIPIDDGQDVIVDGKIVSCRGGTIIITTAPQSGGAIFQPTGPATGGILEPTRPASGGVLEPTPPKGGSIFQPQLINRVPLLAQP